MPDPDDKNLERALELAFGQHPWPDAATFHKYADVHIRKAIIAHARTLQEQDAQEPVAWMYERPWADYMPPSEVRIERWATDYGRYKGWTETPLYAAPPTKPQQQPQADWLTEALEDLVSRAQICGDGLPNSWHDDARSALEKLRETAEGSAIAGSAARQGILRGIDKCIETLRKGYCYDSYQREQSIAALEKLREANDETR